MVEKKKTKKVAFLNVLGAAGYIACVLQWLWIAAILLPALLKSSFFKSLVPTAEPAKTVVVQQNIANTETPPLLVLLGILLAIIVVGVLLYFFAVKFPRSVAKTGSTVTHAPATTLTPIIVQHSHLTPKQKRSLPAAIIMSMKALLIAVPLLLLFFAGTIKQPLSFVTSARLKKAC